MDPLTRGPYLLQVSSTGAAIRAGLAPLYLMRFASIGLPGGVLMAADAASFDITTAMAGFLGTHWRLAVMY